jgi:hypothetical protein
MREMNITDPSTRFPGTIAASCGMFAAFAATTVPALSWMFAVDIPVNLTMSRITEPARLDRWLLDICVSNLSDS